MNFLDFWDRHYATLTPSMIWLATIWILAWVAASIDKHNSRKSS